MGTFSSIEDVWQYLGQIPVFATQGASAANFGLQGILEACKRLEDPHKEYPAIHIAGTNGKGTTSMLLEHIYSEAGYKTGLFTSPHLLRYNERVRIAGEDISDELLLSFFRKAKPILDELRLSYFEISTALAFWAFREEQVDIAIIEAGLGGRLDSTNIVNPELSIITSIGMDHQDILGHSPEEIALEKAGIIKAGRPVVLGNIAEELEPLFEKEAKARSSKMITSRGAMPLWDKGVVQVRGELFSTRLTEPVNKWNVAAAVLAVQELQRRFPVDRTVLSQAIAHFRGAPARFEKLHPERKWYFSGAHNQQAHEATAETLRQFDEKPVIIFSALKDKLNPEILDVLEKLGPCYFFEQRGERAATFRQVMELMKVSSIDESNKTGILKELETSLVIFTGSFYFYPTVKRWMKELSH